MTREPRETWVEVRCCCQPKKLLGWMVVATLRVRAGDRLTFLARRPPTITPDDEPKVYIDRLTLPLAIYGKADLEGRVHPGVAFKAEHTPIEILRRVADFVEAPPGWEEL